jgi:hypothetical protein
VDVEQGPAGEGGEALQADQKPGRLLRCQGHDDVCRRAARQGLDEMGMGEVGEALAATHGVAGIDLHQGQQRPAIDRVAEVGLANLE